jgi:hypothetical protein
MATKQALLDHYFIPARHQLIDLAAFLDRIDRADGDEDFRIRALRESISILLDDRPARARAVLEALSDHSTEPAEKAPYQGAHGAPPESAE